MALSPAITRGLTNRIASLRTEAKQLRQPMKASRPLDETERHAADLAEEAAVAAEAALSGTVTTDEARAALNAYNDYLDATPSIRRVMGW